MRKPGPEDFDALGRTFDAMKAEQDVHRENALLYAIIGIAAAGVAALVIAMTQT